MSLRLEMLRTARRSLSQLGDSSLLVGDYLRSQLSPEGGFCDRAGRSDLYYTVFGLEASLALGAAAPPQCIRYLDGFDAGQGLDMVHLGCLIRCRASAGVPVSIGDAGAMLSRIEAFRTADGGYNPEPRDPSGSAYGCFLAAMAYEDLGRPIPSKEQLFACLNRLRASDGGFANQPGQAFGLTPSTAATATLLRSLGEDAPAGLEDWLLARRHPESGFYAVPAAPIPDLLSTATALHALSYMGAAFDGIREPCLDFVHSLWTGEGAFAGSWADPTPDCEYTYYGLLALGHLAQ